MTWYVRPYRGKADNGFEVDIKILMPDGTTVRERRRSPVATKSGSEAWAKRREGELLRDGMAPKAPKKVVAQTLATFWPKFIEGHAKANKQKPSGIESKEYHFRQYLEPVLGALPLNEITTAKITELKRYMTTQLGAEPTHKSTKGKAASTINGCLSSLSKCLKCAVDWEVVPVMPCKITRLKQQGKVPPFYDFDVYERLVASAAQLDPRIYLVVLLGGDAGLRRGEIIALEQLKCDTRNNRLLVELNQVGKSAHELKGMELRSLPMTERLRDAVKAYKHLRGPRLLYQDDGATLTARTIRTWLATAQKAAELRKTSGEVHILRHTFCTHLAMRGVPVTVIQKLAGHKHLTTTIKYMHVVEGETDRAIRQLGRGTGSTSGVGLVSPKNNG